jgi:hypothetical protein
MIAACKKVRGRSCFQSTLPTFFAAVAERCTGAVAPAAVIAVTGFALAIAVSNEVLLYVSVSLLGFSTSFYGALFAIASLACYPPHLFAKVSGSLLMPIGVGAAVAALLPGLAVDSGVQFSTIWGALALAVVLTSLLFVGAEIMSPVRRTRIAQERDQTDS